MDKPASRLLVGQDMNTVFNELYHDHLQEMVQAIVNAVDPYMIILGIIYNDNQG